MNAPRLPSSQQHRAEASHEGTEPFSEAPRSRLADIAEVLSGFSLPGAASHDPAGNHQILLPKHLSVDGAPYRYEPDHELTMALPARAEPYVVRTGDVVFVSRGTRNRATLISEPRARTVAPLFFYIVRPTSLVRPDFLAWVMNQEVVQVQLESVRQSAGTALVPRARLMDLTLPLPSLADQAGIARLADLMRHELALARRLERSTQQKHRALAAQLLGR